MYINKEQRWGWGADAFTFLEVAHMVDILRHGNVGVHGYTWYIAGVSCAKVLRLRCFGVGCVSFRFFM